MGGESGRGVGGGACVGGAGAGGGAAEEQRGCLEVWLVDSMAVVDAVLVFSRDDLEGAARGCWPTCSSYRTVGLSGAGLLNPDRQHPGATAEQTSVSFD